MCLSQFCYLPHTACLSGWLICWKNSIGNKRERKERDSKKKKKKRKPDNQRRGKKQKSKCSPLVWSEKRWGTEWKKTTYFTTLLLFFFTLKGGRRENRNTFQRRCNLYIPSSERERKRQETLILTGYKEK